MCFPCALNANTLVIQFDIYFCQKQHAAIEYKGGFPACIKTIIIFPLLEILYWEVMPPLRVESWQSAGTLALERSVTLQRFSRLTSKTKRKKKKSHGSGRAGWSHHETGAVRAPNSPISSPQVLLKHICLSLMEASGHQLTNTVPSHRSQSRNKHVGDRRVISIAETSIRYNWLCLFSVAKRRIPKII